MLPYCLIFNNCLPKKICDDLKKIATVIYDDSNSTNNVLEKVTAVVVPPTAGFDPLWFDRLPALKLIAVYGVGTDRIDLKQARTRNIDVATTLDILTEDVTDMAFALLLALTRRIVEGDATIRSGKWATSTQLTLGTSLRDKRLGIIGLGAIGHDIAKRGEAFGMKPHYYNRTLRDTPWPHYNTVEKLAANSDILAVAISATTETQNIVNAQVLDALGPNGIVINIARGAVIDENALITALQNKRIAGAGLDVFLNEPNINPAFFTLPNTVLAPHQGSATIETRYAMGQCVINNIKAVFDHKNPLTVVN